MKNPSKLPAAGRDRRANRRGKKAASQPASAAGRRLQAFLPGIGAMALAAIAYWKALDNPFVYDDHLTVSGNPSLVPPINVKALLLHFPFRPMVNVSYAIDRAVWGTGPSGFHLTSFLLHLLNTFLVYVLARRVASDADAARGGIESNPRDRAAIAFVVAGLFAVHPMLFQVVGYVSARSELLATAFVLTALLLLRDWIDTGGASRAAAALVLFAAGMASKETGAALPFIVLAWDRLLRLGSDDRRRWRLLWFHAPLIALVALGGVVRLTSFLHVEAALPRSVSTNLMSQLSIVWRYLSLLLVPIGQSVVHAAQTATSLASPRVAISLLALIASAAAAWWLRRRAPVVVLGWVWVLVALAPSSVVPLNELMAEHRVGLAAVGFFLMVGAAAFELRRRFPSVASRRLQALALIAVLVALIGLTWRRAEVWSDEVLLWTEATERAPKTWASHFFLGEALRRRDGCAASLASYRAAIPLLPDNEMAHLRIGVCLADAGQTAAARTEFETALAINAKSTQALDYMGRITGNEGRYDLAKDYFERAVAAEPNNVTALLDLARLHEVVLHQPAEALRLCREALSRGEVRGQSAECVRRNEAALAGSGSAG